MSAFKYSDSVKEKLKSAINWMLEPNPGEEDLETKIKNNRAHYEKLQKKLLQLEADHDKLLKSNDETSKLKVATTHAVLTHSVDEMSMQDLLDPDRVKLMQTRIDELFKEYFPDRFNSLKFQTEPRFILSSFGQHEELFTSNQPQGRLLVDAVTGEKYLFVGYDPVNRLATFKMKPGGKAGELGNDITLPAYQCSRLGLLAFNGWIYFVSTADNMIKRFSPKKSALTSAKQAIPYLDANASWNWGGNSATSLHIDELGMWLVTQTLNGYLTILKINPETLEVQKTTSTTLPCSHYGGGFMICGWFYLVTCYNSGGISKAVNAVTGKTRDVAIAFPVKGYHSSSTYVPRERTLYTVDNSKVLRYKITYNNEPDVDEAASQPWQPDNTIGCTQG